MNLAFYKYVIFLEFCLGLTGIHFLAVTIKLHLQKCIKKYPETVEFLNKIIYEDDVIGSQSFVEQALSTASLWTFLKKLVCN